MNFARVFLGKIQGMTGEIGGQHRISEFFQNLPGKVQDRCFVFDDEDDFTVPDGEDLFGAFLSGFARRFSMAGKVDFEGSALSRFTVDVDETVILLDDAIDGGKSQTRALAHSFRRKEGFEDFLDGLTIHAATIIADRQKHIFPWDESEVIGTIRFVEGRHASLNGDPAHSINSIPSVDTEIGQNLINLGGVHFHRPKSCCGTPDQVKVFTYQPTKHFEHTLYRFIQIKHQRGDDLLSGKGEKLPGNSCGTDRGIVALTEVFGDPVSYIL